MKPKLTILRVLSNSLTVEPDVGVPKLTIAIYNTGFLWSPVCFLCPISYFKWDIFWEQSQGTEVDNIARLKPFSQHPLAKEPLRDYPIAGGESFTKALVAFGSF